jgi:hypothetical protein
MIELDLSDVGVLESRYELSELLNLFDFKTMIEIGVHKGEFANGILSNWTMFEHYYGIDVGKHQANYSDGTNLNDN